jgi:hypothetical protein
MIISKTPFRMSFFGGGTDYPALYQKHGGAVLSTAIDKYCYLTCRYLPPFFEHRFRILYSLIETVREVREIKHPAVRAGSWNHQRDHRIPALQPARAWQGCFGMDISVLVLQFALSLPLGEQQNTKNASSLGRRDEFTPEQRFWQGRNWKAFRFAAVSSLSKIRK